MKEKNQKYIDIISTAHKLFWKHGISRVSIEEVCREANVSKMTFYRFFSNKKELGKTVIDQIIDESILKYREIMSLDIPFEEKIKKQLLLKFEGTREISSELVKDIYNNPKLELDKHWQKRSEEFAFEVKNDYVLAQKNGELRKDVNLNFIFYLNTKIVEVLTDPVLQKMYDSMQDLIMEYANLIFYGIVPSNKKPGETKDIQ